MFDYHVHSTFSFDGLASIGEMARAAREKGLSEICFTEHLEVGYPYPVVETELDAAAYRAGIARARADVPGIGIKIGVEAALAAGRLEEIAADVAAGEYDFVIASQHVAGRKDPWFGDYFDGITLREGQRIYLEELYANLAAFDEFDVVGHIGYVDKYLDRYPQLGADARPFTYADFPELLDAILKSAVSRGKGIEVNTSSYAAHGMPTPCPGVIRRFVELGGEVLTMGSDAHGPAGLGQCFAEARELLLECGVKRVCTFEARVPTFHQL